jgi:hypothetical protein
MTKATFDRPYLSRILEMLEARSLFEVPVYLKKLTGNEGYIGVSPIVPVMYAEGRSIDEVVSKIRNNLLVLDEGKRLIPMIKDVLRNNNIKKTEFGSDWERFVSVQYDPIKTVTQDMAENHTYYSESNKIKVE